jgi:hypothetical protein
MFVITIVQQYQSSNKHHSVVFSAIVGGCFMQVNKTSSRGKTSKSEYYCIRHACPRTGVMQLLNVAVHSPRSDMKTSALRVIVDIGQTIMM